MKNSFAQGKSAWESTLKTSGQKLLGKSSQMKNEKGESKKHEKKESKLKEKKEQITPFKVAKQVYYDTPKKMGKELIQGLGKAMKRLK